MKNYILPLFGFSMLFFWIGFHTGKASNSPVIIKDTVIIYETDIKTLSYSGSVLDLDTTLIKTYTR